MAVRFPQQGVPVSNEAWDDGAIVVNPGTGAVLVDTGALPAGKYFFQFIMDATVTARFRREHRNAANTITLASKELPLTADIEEDKVMSVALILAEGERVRIVNVTAYTGNGQVTILRGRLV